MRRWLIRPCRTHSRLSTIRSRSFSTQNHERVEVRCGSSGSVSIDLFNISGHSSTSTFFINLPSYPSSDGAPAPLPNFLQGKPVATINYRWNAESEVPGKDDQRTLWPTPVHDTSFAYSWLVDNLAPSGNQRRDIYVYGSFVGASLATSLSLTEAHPHMRFAVRGGIAYNGIYNWTMFLPDHPIYKTSKRSKTTTTFTEPPEDTHMHHLHEELPALFKTPADTFDPFASPSLFFHSPGLAVPQSFYISTSDAAAIETFATTGSPLTNKPKTPRKSVMVFPPRQSTLKLPEMLLLHDSPVIDPQAKSRRRSKKATARGNTFQNQAEELAAYVKRSIDKVELKERIKWDDDIDSWESEAGRRVTVVSVGEERRSLELSDVGDNAVQDWLEERVQA